jgi:hypothetical protein
VGLDAVRRALDRRAFAERLRKRSPVKLKVSAGEMLTLERKERGI